MASLSFDPEYRRIWMFPRNIRNIEPWKLYQILMVLMKCSDLEYRDIQDQRYLYVMLEEAGVKRKANVKNVNPGGMRTYYAQLETLGLIYENKKGDFRYTIAGREFIEGNALQKVLQYQLLRHQYPSAYGMNQNVKMDPRIKVKPFLFLIKLLHDLRLKNYLTCSDMVIPVIYGHNDDCYEKCVIKIQKLRCYNGDIESVLDNFLLDLYTPRSGMGKNINNVKDIANTAKNYLEASGLITKDGKIYGEQKYIFDPRFEETYRQLKDEPILVCNSRKGIEAFQRAYGRYLLDEDTRQDEETFVTTESPETAFVQFRYALYANANTFDDDTAFYREMWTMDIDESFVAEAILPYSKMRKTIDRNNFIDYASGNGAKTEEFKTSIINMFRKFGLLRVNTNLNIEERKELLCLLFESSRLGGRLLVIASDSSNYVYEEGDIPDRFCFNAPNCILILASDFRFNIKTVVEEESKKHGVPVTALNARTLLRFYELNSEEKNDEFFKSMQKGGYITEEEVSFGDRECYD